MPQDKFEKMPHHTLVGVCRRMEAEIAYFKAKLDSYDNAKTEVVAEDNDATPETQAAFDDGVGKAEVPDPTAIAEDEEEPKDEKDAEPSDPATAE